MFSWEVRVYLGLYSQMGVVKGAMLDIEVCRARTDSEGPVSTCDHLYSSSSPERWL